MCECPFSCNNYPECTEFWQKGFDPDSDNEKNRQTGILIGNLNLITINRMDDLKESDVKILKKKVVSA